MKYFILLLAALLSLSVNAKVHDDIILGHRVVHCKTTKVNDNVLVPRMGIALNISQYGDTIGNVILRYSDVLQVCVGPFPKGSKLMIRLKNGEVIESESKKDAMWTGGYRNHRDNGTDKLYDEETDAIVVFPIEYNQLQRLLNQGIIKMRIIYDDQYKDYLFEGPDFDKAKSEFAKQYVEESKQINKEHPSFFVRKKMEDF